MRSSTRAFAGMAIVLGVLANGSCKDSDDSAPVSCDSAAEHLNDVCGDFIGESFRAICEAESVPLVTPLERRCVARLRKCDEPSLEACDVHDVTIACSSDDPECPEPLQCDADAEQCVRCKRDSDCAAGRGCLMGLCYDEDSELFITLRKLEQPDAGSDAGG